jgi:holo-[acyl-carrier protein] synthase
VIRGIGVDIIEIHRIEGAIRDGGERFLDKLFTAGEIAYCSGKRFAAQHYAARFAAKEALSKALATGWAGAFRWRDVEIMNDPSGRPRVLLHGSLRDTLAPTTLHVSLSHSDSHVVAMVVIEDAHP